MEPKDKLSNGCASRLQLSIRAESHLNEAELYDIGRTILLVVQEALEGGPNGILQMREDLLNKYGVVFMLSTGKDL